MIKIIGAVGAFATLSLIAFKLPSILNVLKKDWLFCFEIIDYWQMNINIDLHNLNW